MTTWNLQTDAPDQSGFGMQSGAWARSTYHQLVNFGTITADANEKTIFTRELEHMESEILRADYPDVKYTEIVDVQVNGLDPADRKYVHRERDRKGQWQLKTAGKKAEDYVGTSEERDENEEKFYSFMSGYDYDFQDLREARRLGHSLEADRGIDTREGWEFLLEEIIARGYAGTKLKGFLNNPAVNVDTEASALHTLDANSLFNRCKTIVSEQVLKVKDIGGLMPNQWTIYPDLFEALATKHFSTDNTQTVLVALRAHFEARGDMPGFRIVPWRYTENAGVSSRHRTALHRKNPRIVKALVSVPFEQFPIHRTGLGWVVPCHGRTAGVATRKPAAVNYVDVPVS